MKNKILVGIICGMLIIAITGMVNLKSENEKLLDENIALNQIQIDLNELVNSLKVDKNKLYNKTVELEIDSALLKKKYDDDKVPSSRALEILKRKGVDDHTIILKDLKNQADLIGYEGILGGTMRFIVEDSKLLNEKYVLAYFEDGHIGGYTLLKYSINKKLDIEWNVLESEVIN